MHEGRVAEGRLLLHMLGQNFRKSLRTPSVALLSPLWLVRIFVPTTRDPHTVGIRLKRKATRAAGEYEARTWTLIKSRCNT